MKIADIIAHLESVAHPSLQEHYDNTGLITGNIEWPCTGAIISLDATEAVIKEAIEKNCNLIISHHPIVFSGLKKISGNNYVEKAVISAIKNDVAIYAMHTNLDNVVAGVNGTIADKLGLVNASVLKPKTGVLKKLFVFVPTKQAEQVRNAVFAVGGGDISNYSECSFNTAGTGTFRPQEGARPFTGEIGKTHSEEEMKIEVIFPGWLEAKLITAMKLAHPYEEVAYDVVGLDNKHSGIGSGIIGNLPEPMDEMTFLGYIKHTFQIPVLRHTALTGRPVNKIAVCGGAGSFLIPAAVNAGADFYITADVKYHEFFDANDRLVIADVGHYESEQYTIDLLASILLKKFPTFAALKTTVKTNPVHYFL
jgi:dinuclear metal center YbgI/SA1388 family protein